MTEIELLALRTALVTQRHLLIARLAADVNDGAVIEPAFLHLLVDIQTVLAAIDAVHAEAGPAPGPAVIVTA
jgi:hypothetical protein